MRIALISDIHSNYFYFKKIMEYIEKENINHIFCLGDIIGYYDNPNEVIDMCIRHDIKAIKGNHEKYIFDEIKYTFEKEDIYGIGRQKNILKKESIEFLRNLPDYLDIQLNGKKLYLTHSLPNDCVSYCYAPEMLDKDFISNYDYYCLGHTHIPLLSFYSGACILNPGSVGQPRDFTKMPSFLILNLNDKSISLHRIDIDYATYKEVLTRERYHDSLINILEKDRTNG